MERHFELRVSVCDYFDVSLTRIRRNQWLTKAEQISYFLFLFLCLIRSLSLFSLENEGNLRQVSSGAAAL